jgi:hypothetical protein
MRMKSMERVSIYVLLLTLLAGCAAAWGGSYNIKEKSETGITIQYDTALNSSPMMQKMARTHCEKFNKATEVVSAKMPGLLLGIIEEKYACIEKSAK